MILGISNQIYAKYSNNWHKLEIKKTPVLRIAGNY